MIDGHLVARDDRVSGACSLPVQPLFCAASRVTGELEKHFTAFDNPATTMSDDITIAAEPRTKTGTTEARRLRRNGRIPANIFGHKMEPVAVSIEVDAFRPVLATGHKVVDLKFDGGSQKALVRDVHWDTFSTMVQHIDFQRVDVTERMIVEVPIVLRGTPQGVVDGGILDHQLHTLAIEATAVSLPDKIEIRVNDLKIGDAIHVSDVTDLPGGVVMQTPGDLLIVQVNAAVEIEEIDEGGEEGMGALPELVGRKPEDDESSDG